MNELWVSIIVAAIMSSPGWIALFVGLKKNKAETQDKIADAADKSVDTAMALRQAVMTENKELRDRVIILEAKVAELTHQIEELKAENKQLKEAKNNGSKKEVDTKSHQEARRVHQES
jgi:FtsZ-binding cell division protein ZapB